MMKYFTHFEIFNNFAKFSNLMTPFRNISGNFSIFIIRLLHLLVLLSRSRHRPSTWACWTRHDFQAARRTRRDRVTWHGRKLRNISTPSRRRLHRAALPQAAETIRRRACWPAVLLRHGDSVSTGVCLSCVALQSHRHTDEVAATYSYMHIIFQDNDYTMSLIKAELDTLESRRDQLTERFFQRNVLPESSCMHCLLPDKRDPSVTDRLRHPRNFKIYNSSKFHHSRFFNSLSLGLDFVFNFWLWFCIALILSTNPAFGCCLKWKQSLIMKLVGDTVLFIHNNRCYTVGVLILLWPKIYLTGT